MFSDLSPEDRKLRQTIAWPLTSANNYPDRVAVQVLGADMSPIIDAVFNALKSEGYVKPVVPTPRPVVAYPTQMGSKALTVAPMNLMPEPGVMFAVGNDKGSKVVWSSQDPDTIKALILDIAAAVGIKIAVE